MTLYALRFWAIILLVVTAVYAGLIVSAYVLF